MKLRRRLKYIVGIVVVVLANVIMGWLVHAGRVYEPQAFVNDLLIGHSTQQIDPRIVVVAIDDQSLKDFGPLGSWDRGYYAQLIAYLKNAGARTVAFDVLFDLPTARDGLFAQALAYARSTGGGTPPMPVILAEDGDGANQHVPGEGLRFEQYLRPSQGILAGQPILAGVNVDPEGAEVRHLPLRSVAGDQQSFVLPFVAALAYQAKPGEQQGIELAPNGITAGGRFIPTDPTYRMLIDFAGPPFSAQHVSFSRVLAQQYPPSTFKDKLVFVGMMGATGLADDYPVPTSNGTKMWGVEIWAHSAQNILNGKFVAPQGEGSTLLLMALFSAAAAAAFFLWGAWGWLPAAALMAVYGAGVSLWTLRALDGARDAAQVIALPNVVYVDGTVFVSSAALFACLFVFEQRARRAVNQMFGKYVTPEVARMLMQLQEQGELGLGGARKTATIMFGDIRGFTTLSEGMEPEEVMAMLNRYFDHMVDIITKHGGTISKYIGDNVMVLFNLPVQSGENHALAAARAGFEIQEWIQEYRAQHPEEKAAFGFGISTGELLAGNMGSQERMEYTVVGDPVRQADELCATALANEVAISEATYEMIKGTGIQVLDKGMVTVKGKTTEVHMYTITGLPEQAVAA